MGSSVVRSAPKKVVARVLDRSLRLLHPFMPFITEEIWQKLPKEGSSIMMAPFPVYEEAKEDPKTEKDLALVKDIITSVRNIRGEMNLNPGLALNLLIKLEDPETGSMITKNINYIKEWSLEGQAHQVMMI